jgi:hypothetical protein
MSVCQGATDPTAIHLLAGELPVVEMYHLPRLHAKVYVSGTTHAIVTSGNLTSGGLGLNYEYGIRVDDPAAVALIRRDVLDYAGLGAPLSRETLLGYCQVAGRLRESFQSQLSKIAKGAREEFRKVVGEAEDELIKLRLGKGALHKVFEDAILYVLRRKGPLETQNIHVFIKDNFPDLCDDSVDRVIAGVRYGKKWKHAVRSAQQHLKARGVVEYNGGRWRLTPG